jgi:hypothetical protein
MRIERMMRHHKAHELCPPGRDGASGEFIIAAPKRTSENHERLVEKIFMYPLFTCIDSATFHVIVVHMKLPTGRGESSAT